MHHRILTLLEIPYILIIPYFLLASKANFRIPNQLLLLENFVSKCLHSANLLSSRSFHSALSASFMPSTHSVYGP